MLPSKMYRVVGLALIALCWFFSPGSSQTLVTGSVSGTWTKANQPYIISGGVSVGVGETLTIEPGVEIHSRHYTDQFVIYGTLRAQGTAADSIRFRGFVDTTSAQVSTHGGTLIFAQGSQGSALSYAVVDRWGDQESQGAALQIATSSLQIHHVSIRKSEATAIRITLSNETALLQSLRFESNGKDIEAPASSVGGIKDCPNAKIYLRSDANQASFTMPKPGLGAYYVLEGGFVITAGTTATLQPGVAIHSLHYGDQIVVYGSLKAVGTAADSIRFRGFANPSLSAASTHGGNLLFDQQSKDSELSYVVMDRWGDKDFHGSALKVYASSLRITHASFRNAEDVGLFLGQAAAGIHVSDNAFARNGRDVRADPNALSGVRNLTQAKIFITDGSLLRSTTWPKQGLHSYYLFEGSVNLPESDTLTLEAGTSFDIGSNGVSLNVNGTLRALGTQENPIAFTRLTAFDQSGIVYLQPSSRHSVLTHVHMDGWGGPGAYALYVGTADASLQHLTITNASAIGLYYTTQAQSQIENARFAKNKIGVYVASGRPRFLNCIIEANTEWGIQNQAAASDTVDARGSFWGDGTGPYHAGFNPQGKGNPVSDRVLFTPWVQQETKTSQLITFPALRDQYVGDTLRLQASASSGLPITYRLRSEPASGVAQLTGATVTFLGEPGTVWITAFQGGNAFFDTAQTQRSFQVFKRSQTIDFAEIPTQTIGTAPLVLRARASSGLPVQVHLITGPGLLRGDTLVMTGTGVITLEASQAGNRQYEAATPVRRSFTVVARLPDLALMQVSSAAGPFAPGDSVSLTWRVVNQGLAPARVNWIERIYVQSPGGPSRTWVQDVPFSQASLLDTGQVLTRRARILFPPLLGVGSQGVFVVELLPGEGLEEISPLNNVAIQGTPWTVQAVLTLHLGNTALGEGEAPLTGVVQRSGALTQPVTVQLQLTQQARFSIPATLLIPAGESQAYFTIAVPDNQTLEGSWRDTLRVTAPGLRAAQLALTVEDNDQPTLAFQGLPKRVTEGDTLHLRVTTNAASKAAVEVFLSSSHPSRLPVPASVHLPAGALFTNLTLVVPSDELPQLEAKVILSAGASGHHAASDTLTIIDDDLPGLELVLDTSVVSEAAGTAAIRATLVRTGKNLAYTIHLSADLPQALSFPPTLSLAANETQKSFTIGVIDNAVTEGDRSVHLTAALYLASCGCNAPPASAGTVTRKIVILDNDGPTLQLSATPSTLPEGRAAAGILRITRNTSLSQALVVQLNSSDPGEASLPASVTIPAGQASVEVAIATHNDGLADGSQRVVLQATAPGFTAGSVTVWVTDFNKPDLQIASTQLSRNQVQAGEQFTYQVALTNSGQAPAPAGVLVRGYLSQDEVLDASDVRISETRLPTELAAGQTLTLRDTARAPEGLGTYQVFFWVDPQGALTELLTTNNQSTAVPLTILPDYTATARVVQPYFLKGSSVLITGKATRSNGSAAANQPVEVYVIVHGLRRLLAVQTDAQGSFTTTFKPLAEEAGHYSVGASYPGLGQTTEQDAFDILGLRIQGGQVPQWMLTRQQPLTGQVSVENLSGKSLSNVTLAPQALPNGLSLQFEVLGQLPGYATASLSYTITSSTLSAGNEYQSLTLEARSGEGKLQTLPLFYYCQAPQAHLQADMALIETFASQAVGERLVEFRLVNTGKGPAEQIRLSLPQVNYLRRVSAERLPTLASGDTAVVLLKFLALPEVPLGQTLTGSIGVQVANGDGLSLPYRFTKVASAFGKAEITVTDQYTYYTENGPKVKGAHVQLKNYYTGAVVAEGLTGDNGVFTAPELPEGTYRLIVEKEKHAAYNNLLTIDPGMTTARSIFINYQAITFSWNVVPTAVQDQYDITLKTQFETNVPMPVVTLEMPKKLPHLAEGQEHTFVVTLTNHGLITANALALLLPESDPDYEFTTAYVPADLAAQQRIQVPVLMRRRKGAIPGGRIGAPSLAQIAGFLGGMQKATQEQGSECPLFIGHVYTYTCNTVTGLWDRGGELFSIEGRDCGNRGGGGGTGSSGSAAHYLTIYDWWVSYMAYWGARLPHIPCVNCSGPGLMPEGVPARDYELPKWMTEKKSCNECIDAIGGIVIDLLKDFAIDKISKKVSEKLGLLLKSFDLGLCLGENIVGTIGKTGETLGDVLTCFPMFAPIGTINDLKDALITCLASLKATSATRQRNEIVKVTSSSVYEELNQDLLLVVSALEAQNSWSKDYFGNLLTAKGWPQLAPKLHPFITHWKPIGPTDEALLIQEMTGYEIAPVNILSFIRRWNASVEALQKGIYQPTSQYPEIINWIKVKQYSDIVIQAKNQAKSKGFESISDLYDYVVVSLFQLTTQAKDEVCASVSVQLSQQLTMTREAFAGTLEIFNGHPTSAMQNLTLTIQITDEQGVPSNGRFEIQAQGLTHVTNVTGTGSLAAQQTGSVKYLFIPKVEAAPQSPKVYRFGGSIRYLDPYANAMVTLPLAPVALQVNPSPQLMLHYFMERNILGDDALTAGIVEPSVPADLAVLVENQGYGPAVNVTISSAQPKIVDNEKGLAVDFQLTGSNFQGQAKKLGLTTIPFGSIPALQARVGQWYFTSSLLGKMVSYEANVVHNNSLGSPELSLVQGVKLHELTKTIRLYGSLEDGIGDFLVNDVFDVDDRPDQIYFSQGHRTARVNPAASGRFSAVVAPPTFTNTLTVTASDTGFNYLKLADPGQGQYELVSVTRNDGQKIPLDNVWLTHVTLPVSRAPIYEHKFHFLDHFASKSPVTYTVVWKAKALLLPQVLRIEGVPTQVSSSPVQTLRVVFNKAIDPATFNHEDLTLRLQGGPNLSTTAVQISTQDSVTFVVNLAALTTGNGLYTLVVQAAEIADLAGVKGQEGTQVSWTQALAEPRIEAFLGLPAGGRAAAYDRVQLLFNQALDPASVVPARFSVYKNGLQQTGTLKVDSLRADHRLVYLSGIQQTLTEDGAYDLRVDVPLIRSATQVAGGPMQSVTLILDRTGPRLDSLRALTKGNADLPYKNVIRLRFNEGVVGLNTASFELRRDQTLLALPAGLLTSIDARTWELGDLGTLAALSGTYTFRVKLTSIRDSLGNVGVGSSELTWTVGRPANQPPRAHAGVDRVVTQPGWITLDGSQSSDPDGDSLHYAWKASPGLQLKDSTRVKASLLLTAADQGKTYPVVLTVSDGQWTDRDTVLIRINYPVVVTGLASAYCENQSSVSLTGQPLGGQFSGPGISGTSFSPTAAGLGTHSIRYTVQGLSTVQTTTVLAAPSLGPDQSWQTCGGTAVDLRSAFTTQGLEVVWNVARPDSVVHPGVYILMVTNRQGCRDTAQITLQALPVLTQDTTLWVSCSSQTVNLLPLIRSNAGVEWSTATPERVGMGTYTALIPREGGCSERLQIEVKEKIATWTGRVSANWHEPGNWASNQIPDADTQVRIGTGTPPCRIELASVLVAGVHIEKGAQLRIAQNLTLEVRGGCP